MSFEEDISQYLPKYLSPETEQKLLEDLADFPNNIDQRMYGFIGKEDSIVYQGDGLLKLPVLFLPNPRIESKPALILSNTCDVDMDNERKYLPANIIYAPIIQLSKYESLLRNSGKISDDSITSHINDIKRQRITQIFYLPPNGSDL
jgi:hypothetical protein